MTIAVFVVLTGSLASLHPSKRQPLPATQKLREGVKTCLKPSSPSRPCRIGT